jgi:hypothetical protein
MDLETLRAVNFLTLGESTPSGEVIKYLSLPTVWQQVCVGWTGGAFVACLLNTCNPLVVISTISTFTHENLCRMPRHAPLPLCQSSPAISKNVNNITYWACFCVYATAAGPVQLRHSEGCYRLIQHRQPVAQARHRHYASQVSEPSMAVPILLL